MTPVLSASQLAFSVGGRPVFAGAGLSLAAGELVALQGPSGAGKTVLGTMLLRLRPVPAPGVVRWGDEDVTAASMSALRPLRPRYQALLQHSSANLPPYMTVGEALAETARHVAGVGGDPLAAVADELGIGALLDRTPRFLSGGEQRRAGLARVLMANPIFAFVDEPDAGLDPAAKLAALSLLRRRCDAGMACLLVTHEPGLAARFADRRRERALLGRSPA